MATYPAGVYSPRVKENIPGVVYAAGEKQRFFVEDIENTDAEIIAIQNKLGITDAVINKCGGMKPNANAVNAIQIQDSVGANILNIDTTNKRVGIGNAAPTVPLDVTGAVKISAALTLSDKTLGSIPFFGASGLVSQDNAKLFWDNTNKRLGIGNAAPTVPLHVTGSTKLAGAAEVTGNFVLTGKSAGSILFIGAGAVVSQDLGELFWDQANNRLGIGTATPTAALHVEEVSTNAQVLIKTVSAGIAYLKIENFNGGAIMLRGDAADSYISTGGDFGLGLTNPTHRLTVYDNVNGYSAKFINDGNLANRAGIVVQAGADTGSGTTYFFRANDGNGTLTGYLQTYNGVFQLADVSDKRRKTNIIDTEINGLSIINGLRVRDFNWKVNPSGPKMRGFIAQEAQKILPSMVNQDEDGFFTTSRSELIPVLVKAIQEQQEQIDELKFIIKQSS